MILQENVCELDNVAMTLQGRICGRFNKITLPGRFCEQGRA